AGTSSNTQITNYTFAASGGSFTALTGSTVVPAVGTYTDFDDPTDEGAYNNLPIGFSFSYLGTNYTTASASTNGFAVLGAAIPTGATAIETYTNNMLTQAL